MRLFFALWPDPATQHAWLDAAAPALTMLGGRPLPAADLHLTLQFLGDTRPDLVKALMRLGDDVAGPAIALCLDRIECWGGADLACLRMDAPPELQRLVGNLALGMQDLGLSPDARRYKPHVTLARRLQHVMPAMPLLPALNWRAGTLALMSSRNPEGGPRYRPLATWELT